MKELWVNLSIGAQFAFYFWGAIAFSKYVFGG